MKKYILVLLVIAVFIAGYIYTGSWKWSLLILAVTLVCVGLQIGMHSLFPKNDTEKQFKEMKKGHIKRTEDNPTLR